MNDPREAFMLRPAGSPAGAPGTRCKDGGGADRKRGGADVGSPDSVWKGILGQINFV